MTPIQPSTSESKIKGKKDHHTRSDLCWWCCTLSSLYWRSADTIESVFVSSSDFDLTISLKKLKSYGNEQIFHQQSRSMTSTSKTLNSLALVLRQTHQWTLRLIVTLVKVVCSILLYGSETCTLSAGLVMFWEWATSASKRLCYTS